MLSYLSLTNVTQNTLNLIVATTKHFPALKAYVIDIHNDSCKLLVSQAAFRLSSSPSAYATVSQ